MNCWGIIVDAVAGKRITCQRVDGMKAPKALDQITDLVLAYRPKAKRKARPNKRRKRHARARRV